MEKIKPNGKALIPFLIFVVFYLSTGIILNAMGVEMAFYQVPSPISIMVGIVAAFFMFKGTINEKVDAFVKGCGDENIIIMCIIYLLAGAFSTVCKATGAVDSVVNLCLTYVPVQFMAAGVFLISVFISTATGTSVGSVVALGSICVGIAEKGGLNVALIVGALVAGAMAGDNLSVISDTTIAATRTQHVNMRDKFIMNSKFAVPAMIITFILLLIAKQPDAAVKLEQLGEYQLVKIIPYLFVLITAVIGINVFVVLFSGIAIAGVIGLAYGSFDLIGLSQNIYNGFTGMTEIFLLSMFTGGLAYMVRKEGGIEWLISKVRGKIKGGKTAELAIAFMTSLTNLAVANNTVSILIVGPIAKDLSKDYEVDPRRIASLLDTFSCIIQGMIPYGAQLLIASSFTNGAVSPVGIIPYLWYLYILAAFAILSIFVRFTDAKTKWNYETDSPVKA